MGKVAEDVGLGKSSEVADTERGGVVVTTVQKVEVWLSPQEIKYIVRALVYSAEGCLERQRYKSIVDDGVFFLELADALDAKRLEALGRK